jgi:hypothetical protein
MADIKKAAQWMRAGSQVRRKAWHPDVPNIAAEDDSLTDEEWTEIIHTKPLKDGYSGQWCLGDLTASDWEIAE